jgi:two-component system sensor histidine kinase and response regulator WspE
VAGAGSTVVLEAPLTRSILRCLLVRIAEEVYAVPLGRVSRVLRLHRSDLRALEGREYVEVDGRNIGVLRASDVLALPSGGRARDDLAALVIGGLVGEHVIVVDAFLGEEDLVVRRLDPRLRGVQNVMAASTIEDGTLVLILDVDDVMRSIEGLLAQGERSTVAGEARLAEKKRVLVVDDALTVREAERQLLAARGYDTDSAVDGVDAWNAVRGSRYDLVVTDIDMPRMDGFELVRAIKSDARLSSIPVVVVSYKDREEDRLRGMQVGADAYLKKGSFDDRALLEIVRDLIGGPDR